MVADKCDLPGGPLPQRLPARAERQSCVRLESEGHGRSAPMYLGVPLPRKWKSRRWSFEEAVSDSKDSTQAKNGLSAAESPISSS